jgi:maleylacetoacetate isomerase
MPSHHIPILYHYWRSSCSWRVRWVLNVKNIKFETIEVDLLKGEHLQPAYRSVSSSGQVPCLKWGEQYFEESLAIIEMLNEMFPTPPLLPTDPIEKARVRQLVLSIVAGTQPLQNMSTLNVHSRSPEHRQELARHWNHVGLEKFTRILQSFGAVGRYAYGSQLTIADIVLIPQMYNAKRFGVDLRAFPECLRIFENCMSRQDCISAAPESYQP